MSGSPSLPRTVLSSSFRGARASGWRTSKCTAPRAPSRSLPTAAEGGGGGWTPSVPTLLSSGSDGEVYVWDVRSRRCLSRFQNEGGTVTSSLACAGGAGAGYIAAGSESGVVNVYDAAALGAAARPGRPRRCGRSSLTTSVDRLCFNSVGDAQILAMSSRRSSRRCAPRAPAPRAPCSRTGRRRARRRTSSALAFSPDSRRFAVGNDRGRAPCTASSTTRKAVARRVHPMTARREQRARRQLSALRLCVSLGTSARGSGRLAATTSLPVVRCGRAASRPRAQVARTSLAFKIAPGACHRDSTDGASSHSIAVE